MRSCAAEISGVTKRQKDYVPSIDKMLHHIFLIISDFLHLLLQTFVDNFGKIRPENYWINTKFAESKLNMMKVNEALFEYIDPDISHQIINGDSLSVLKTIADGKFDLIIGSAEKLNS